MNPINLLVISSMSDFSGGEIVLKRLLTGNSAIDPAFVVPDGRFAEILKTEFREVVILPTLISRKRSNLFGYFLNMLKNIAHLRNIITNRQPDIVLANSLGVALYTAVLKIFTGVPVIYIHHHPVIWKNFKLKVLSACFSLLHSRVVTVSNAVKNSYFQFGFIQNRLLTIYNGLESQFFKHNSESEGAKTPEKFKIALIATITKWKGHHVFINAVEKLKQERPDIFDRCCFLFIGTVLDNNEKDKTYKRELESDLIKKNLTSNFEFTGKIENMNSLYEELHIVINTSIEPEPLGTTIYEAMAKGKLVIASNIGGNSEIIDDAKNGFLVEHSNPDVLSNKLIDCIDNYENMISLSRSAIATAKLKFNLQLMRNSYLKLFATIVRN